MAASWGTLEDYEACKKAKIANSHGQKSYQVILHWTDLCCYRKVCEVSVWSLIWISLQKVVCVGKFGVYACPVVGLLCVWTVVGWSQCRFVSFNFWEFEFLGFVLVCGWVNHKLGGWGYDESVCRHRWGWGRKRTSKIWPLAMTSNCCFFP